MPKSRGRKKPKTSIKMSEPVQRALQEQRTAFIAKFGREPGPGDPVFFDPNADTPQPLDMDDMQTDVITAMRKSGVDEAIIYAYQKTGMLMSETNRHGFPAGAVKAWNAAIDEYQVKGKEAAEWSWRNPGFRGVFEFDIGIEILGKRVERRAKIDYTLTPDWEYWDLNKKALFTGVYSSSFKLSLLAMPEKDEEDKPEWTVMGDITQNGVLSEEIWDAIDCKLDERCRMEDAERRQAAGLAPQTGDRPH
jgi:hypothetical protein